MPRDRDRVRLLHMLEHAQEAVRLIVGRTRRDLDADRLLNLALVRLLEIVVPLGAGGMGEVYRAKDTRLGREVAVKVLPQHLSSNPAIRARFEREAKTISSLTYPGAALFARVTSICP
jgi:serine/threonine protein kinase